MQIHISLSFFCNFSKPSEVCKNLSGRKENEVNRRYSVITQNSSCSDSSASKYVEALRGCRKTKQGEKREKEK